MVGRSIDFAIATVYVATMISISIPAAKKHLSKYLANLRPGDRILICKRNVPIAELRALPRQGAKPRPIGLAKGEFSVPANFLDPLPANVLEEFDGGRDRGEACK